MPEITSLYQQDVTRFNVVAREHTRLNATRAHATAATDVDDTSSAAGAADAIGGGIESLKSGAACGGSESVTEKVAGVEEQGQSSVEAAVGGEGEEERGAQVYGYTQTSPKHALRMSVCEFDVFYGRAPPPGMDLKLLYEGQVA